MTGGDAAAIQSMTGYGSATAESEALRAAVTVRSVNHRYLDVSLRLSRTLSPLESEIKGLVQSRLNRGRVELAAQATFQDGEALAVVTSRPLVNQLVRALREIQTQENLGGEIRISDVARFPGVLEVVESAPAALDARREGVLSLVGAALDGLVTMRRAEGAHLAAALLGALSAIEEGAARIESLAASGQAARRDTLAERVRALTSELGLEDTRLYQEVVRLVDRLDVSEELARLRSHVAQARALVEAGGACGKRLDFLAQELMREANTIGSKASSATVVQDVVSLKSRIEAFREQVQNVE